MFFDKRAPKVIGTSDSVLVADFANATGDPVFDGSLRQGLEVQLEQSPSLRFVSEDRIQRGLAMMGQPPNARLTPQIARELCQRTQSAVVINGSILQIGAQYLLTIKAVDCANGESLASAEERAGDKNRVLDALGKAASGVRNKLGESLNTVQKYDTPLEQATTPSLEALKAYSLGRKAQSTAEADAIPFYKRAIELDPNFALAYAWLGVAYTTLGEPGVAAGYTAKAYQLREQASEPEKYFISAIYNKEVTGNIEQAEQTCKLWMQAYPRADMPHVYLSGALYPIQGEYEKAVHEAQEGIRLNPDNPISYAFLIFADIALGRLDDAKAAHQRALQRKLDNALFSPALYQIAFLRNDAAEMAQHSTAANGQPGIEDELLSLEADTAAYSGHLRRARENSLRAVDSAKRAGEKETAATYTAISALREALVGTSDLARKDAAAAIQAAPGRDAKYGAALALAYARDERRVQALIAELEKRFPEATIVQFNYLPTLRAKLSLNRGNAAEAIEFLKRTTHFELGQSTDSTYGWTTLYPVLVRGEAFLSAHQGNLAAAEFQKILDHPGILLNSPIAPLARLGLARAYLLQGDTAKACVAYQDFLKLWKDADADVPVLLTAKVEYAQLQ
jgi:tetratricopeptide (TPR) repeat protein